MMAASNEGEHRVEAASIWQGATQAFVVGFPPPMQSLLYWGFASLVVHVCQRLVEHTAFSVDPSSRRISASHAALCIGCIVWALDVVGLFMYSELSHHALELGPALGCLLVMVFSARLTIPTLSSSTSTRSLIPAGLVLALGMLAGHFLLANSYVADFSEVNALAIAVAIATAMGVACYTAIRHRAAKMSALTPRYTPQNWRDKFLSGGAILVLHWLLINCFPLQKPNANGQTNGLALLAVLLVFTLALAVEQLRNIRSDQVRQHLQRLGLSLMRVTLAHQKPPEHDIQLSLIADHLPRLLNRNSLTLHFQPIVNLYGPQVHYEALLRLNDPLLGPLSPDAFFLVCELQSKTSQVDRLVLANALDAAQGWLAQGMPSSTVCVNVAPVTLLEPGFAQWLGAKLQRRGLPWGMLQLELTEHAIIACGAHMVQAINDLRTLGVGVFMDDFGAGYSSLGVLADLPISGIKCDRLFVRQLPQDPRRQSLLRHVVRLARDLQLEVVVEGVETEQELQSVLESGIGNVQGYFFSKAMPPEAVPQWHKAYRPAEITVLPPRPSVAASPFLAAPAPMPS
ncbi:EAL domain-containing protein (putative c-di-GMP-specific phosphodiesterase class I) [Acidovorax sp. 62]|uniref:EAL domain-containing protein n=1 Tax=Acidovorax sp. 62 TaxID=2035203 RepID=UPI000C56088D|nr:EAL domain-containing protein [Acidovorax sp. 62]PIF89990.1 EAL domain-containing protein (putative c-di-GMP-specific phosphodiesterase class I) [Acidovorax sp. 62]